MQLLVGTRILAVLLFVPLASLLAMLGCFVGSYLTVVVILQGNVDQQFVDTFFSIFPAKSILFCIISIGFVTLQCALVACFYGMRDTGGRAGRRGLRGGALARRQPRSPALRVLAHRPGLLRRLTGRSDRRLGVSGSTARRLALGALIAGAAGVLFLVLGGSDSGHRVSAVAPSAANLLPGQEINAAGHKVGSVTSVEPVDGGRSARINMRIDDEDYWPLPRDSKLEARFGGTVSFSSRYLLLTRGKDRGHLIDEGGELLRANVKVPVEVDEFISIFNRSARRDFKRFIENGAPVFESGGPDLNRALGKSTPVVEGASGVFAGPDEEPEAARDARRLDRQRRRRDRSLVARHARAPHGRRSDLRRHRLRGG